MGGGSSKSVWTLLQEKTLQDASKLHKQLTQAITDGKIHPADQKEIGALVDKLQGEATARNKALYKKIWVQYDADKDGVLSLPETQALVRDALAETRNFTGVLARVTIASSIDSTKALVRRVAKDSGKTLLPEDFAEIERRFEAMHSKLTEVLDARLSRLIADSEQVADALWRKLKPGNAPFVTEALFLMHYPRAANELLDTQGLLRQIFRDLERGAFT